MRNSDYNTEYVHTRVLQTKLIRWAKEHPHDFPWRKPITPFHALVAEIFLQRTKAEQVVPVFNKFRRQFPTVNDLVKCRMITIRRLMRPLGLIWRADFLQSLGKQIVVNGGHIPNEYDQLIQLPGIGPYAASAYLSLHRGVRQCIIDNNVVRLYCRLLGYPYDGETRRKPWIRELADELTPKKRFKEYNYALLDFTREVCKPRPSCEKCILRLICMSSVRSKRV